MNVVKSFIYVVLSLLMVHNALSSTITITPSGTNNDSGLIQSALDGLQDHDTLLLNGDFVIRNTIYLPSNFTWILNGSLTLGTSPSLNKAGWVGTVNGYSVNALKYTGITEKDWDTTGSSNIDMSGGIYNGNYVSQGSSRVRFINFVRVTNSRFHDMEITKASDDNFTLGPDSRYNECRNLVSTFAGLSPGSSSGNALTDKGDHNKWYDCIAADCTSDGWTPKCRNSEFYRCIGKRNEGPGFGMFCRIDGSGNPVDLGEAIENNKFIECESYENNASGFSLNISSTSGEGGTIRNNYIQAICYNNAQSGVHFRNKQPNSIVENNEINLLCFGNLGQKKSGGNSSLAGGIGTDASSLYPVNGITGTMVSYDNTGADVNVNKAYDCIITVYRPIEENPPVIKRGDISNMISVVDFSCLDTLSVWCQQKYCEQNTVGIIRQNVHSTYSLSQNYPNPVSTSAIIEYFISKECFVKINIFDNTGKLVDSVVNKKQARGHYEIEFNKNNLPDGIYYYIIRAGDFSATKKLIILQ
jgi:hypothetical protein